MASGRELSQKEADIQMMLPAEVHLGTKNCDFQMDRYVFKHRNDAPAPLGEGWDPAIPPPAIARAGFEGVPPSGWE